jgi:hypothetical protein
MFTLIPLDVWVAAVLAAAAGLMAIFGPSAGVFILIYVFLCAYIIVEIIGDEIAGCSRPGEDLPAMKTLPAMECRSGQS